MAEERYQHQRIEDYIQGILSPDERRRFESDLKNDAQLQENYRLQLMEHEAMDHMIGLDLKDRFSRWKDDPPGDAGSRMSVPLIRRQVSQRHWLIIMAVLIGISILIIMVYKVTGDRWSKAESKNQNLPGESGTPAAGDIEISGTDTLKTGGESNGARTIDRPSQEDDNRDTKKRLPVAGEGRYDMAYVEIANEFYHEPEELYAGLRSRKDGPRSGFGMAVELFFTGKYKESLTLLERIPGQSNSNVFYLKGHNYFRLGRYEAAAAEFALLVSDKMLPLYEDARWNLFLSYTAALPASKGNWLALRKELLSDQNFGYQKELEKIILRLEQ